MPEKPKLEQPVVIALVLALAVIAVYWPVGSFDFTNYDDPEYFSENSHVLAGLNWANLKWALQATDNASWYPVTWLSFLLDATLFGKGPGGPHLVNLLLHTANVVLLFLLLRRLTGARWKSALVAGLFALHPLRVEAVAWIAERKGLLSAFFGLLALYAYARYVEWSEGRSPKSKAWYGVAWVCFVLSLMSKPILVTLPFAMLLLDYWPLKRVEYPFSLNGKQACGPYFRNLWRLVLEKVPFFGVAVLSGVVTVWVHKQAGAIQPLALLSLRDRLENAVVSYARYMGKMVWPTGLALPYPHPGHWPLDFVLVAAGVLVGSSLAALWLGRRHAYVLVGWLWFLGTLVPVIGVIQWGGQAMADRFTYIPSVGLFIIVVWAAGELVGGNQRQGRLAATVSLLMLGACAFLARHQVQYWRDSQRLFRHALAVTSNNVVALNSLGFYYVSRGQPEEAERSFQTALGIQPNKYSWHGLGSALIDKRKYAEAVAACEAALKADPEMAKAHSTLGVALTKLGQTNEAMSHYLEALRLQPELAEAHYNLANALASRGQIETARQHYEASLRSDPNSADAHNNLAYMLMRQGKLDRAESEFRSALALRPDLWQARYGLAAVLARQGKTQEAIQVRPNGSEAKP
jgi:Flp pilus assembly protein TadD